MIKTQHRIRRWIKRVAVALGIVVLLVAVLFLVVQTPWAKRRIASAVERALGDLTGSQVRIKSLRGTVPYSIRLNDVSFTDEKGTWLHVADLGVRWAPLALVRGRIHIYEVTSSAVTLERVPPMPPRPPQPPQPWREQIPSLVVERLAIDDLTLGPALVGKREHFRVAGVVSAGRPFESASTTWRVERTDDPSARADVSAALSGESPSLSLDLVVNEPDGAVLRRLAGLRDAGAVTVSLHGEGLLTAWNATLDATAAGLGEAIAQLEVELGPGSIDLKQSNPRVRGSVRANTRFKDQAVHATSTFALDGGRVALSSIAVEGAGNRITGDLALDLASGLLDGELDGAAVSLDCLTSIWTEPLSGSATLHATLSRADNVQTVDLDAHVRSFDGRFGQCKDATIQAQLTGPFNAPHGTARLRASGYVLDDLEIATLEIETEGDRHSLTVTARSTGNYRDPFSVDTTALVRVGGVIELRALEGVYAAVPVRLERPATIVIAPNKVAVSELELGVGDGRVGVSGTLIGEELSGLIEVSRLPLQLLRPVGMPDVDGLASGRVQLAGSAAAARIEAAVAVEDLRWLDPVYAGLPHAVLSANAQFDAGQLNGTLSLDQSGGDGTLTTTFRVPMALSLSPAALSLSRDEPLEVTLTGGVPIAPFSALVLPEGREAEGRLTATFDLGGTIDSPELSGRVALDAGVHTDAAPATSVSALAAAVEVELKQGVLSVTQLSAKSGSTEIAGHATVHLAPRPWSVTPSGPFDGALTVQADLAALGALMLPEGEQVEGRVLLSVSGSGTTDAPVFDGSCRLEAVSYNMKGTGSLVKDLDAGAVFALRDGTLTIADFSATSASGSASGNVRIGARPWPWQLAPQRLLEGKLLADVRLHEALSTLLSDDQRLAGRFEADLVVTGTSDQPAVSGWLRVRDGAFDNLRTGTTLRDITADVKASGSELTLTHLEASDGHEGTITGSGRLDVDAGKQFPFELAVVLTDAAVVNADYITGSVGGNVTLSGSVERMRLAGEVTTGSVDVQLPERVVPALAELNVIEINAPGGAAPPQPLRPPTQPIGLDLDVRLPKRVFVRGHGLDSEWEGRISITGDSENPIITGRLMLTRGRFDLIDRSFVLTEGSIFFSGESPPVPVLTIRAETAAGGMTAVIMLSGPVTAPTLTLSSVPALPSDEVLARVFFGNSVTSLTPYQALRLAQIADALARGGDGFSLLGRARAIMKVDRLELTEGDASGNGASISAGKYLSDDLYIEVKKGVSDSATSVSIEKQVNRHLSVESDIGTNRAPGIGLKLRWDY
ncbi:MAG: translocation/assembly module TamB domain-containing protein [Verrucomicrobia bacterium]|nr:translocation/assembly module TamB domain-containing protein [Verrucomicrobiota bacterium]